MPKKILAFCAILLGIPFLYLGYNWFEDRQWKTELQRDFGPRRADELAQSDALLALGVVDLNPSDLTFAVLQQKLHEPGLKHPGDFNSTRLGWACVKERCAILATFFVPFGQEIPATMTPAGLIISSPAFRDFHNIAWVGFILENPMKNSRSSINIINPDPLESFGELDGMGIGMPRGPVSTVRFSHWFFQMKLCNVVS
jgi:hypothetical protein